MSLKRRQVGNSVTSKHRSDQSPTSVPFVSVGGENGIAQELSPLGMESFSFAEIPELGG